MSVRRLLRRYGFHATVAVGVSLLAVGSWVVYGFATADALADAERAIDEGRPGEARGLLEQYLAGEGSETDRARLLLARARFDENEARRTLSREALSDIEAELQQVTKGKAEEHFDLSWKVVQAYAATGEPKRELAMLDWLGKRYDTRAAIDLARARALVELGPIEEYSGEGAGPTESGEKFEEALRCYSAKSDEVDRDREIAFLRALAHQRSADQCRQGALAQERQLRFAEFRAAIEWSLGQEGRLVSSLEAWVAALPPDRADGSWVQKARLEVADSRIRQAESLDDLRWKESALQGPEVSGSDAAAWRASSEEALTRAQADLESVAGSSLVSADDLQRARFLLADLYRRRGDFERSAALYEQLSKARPDDATAMDGYLRALLGRVRIAIDLAAKGGAWGDAEEILCRFEETVGTQASILAEGGEVYESLRDRRTAVEERDLDEFLRRNDARPELGRARRADVEARVLEFRARYSRHAADLFAGAAGLTQDAAMRLDADWRAAENYRAVGAASAEILALRDFLDRSGGASAGRWGSLFEKTPTAALEHLGRALERLGHFDEAERVHQANVDQYPATPPAYRSRLALGRLAERRADLDEALRRYSSIRNDAQIQFDPQSPIWRIAIHRLAAIYEHLAALGDLSGGLEKAEDLYREAIRRFPEDSRTAEAWYRLGRIANLIARDRLREKRAEEAARRFQEAATNLRQALAVAEGDLASRPVVGGADLGAIEVDLDPPVRPEVMARQARYTLADALYERALAAPEADRPGLLAEAFAAYEEAVGQHPEGLDEAWGFYQEGQIHRLLGRPERAKSALDRTLSVLEKARTGGSLERPEGIDPGYWAGILEWEARFRQERR